MTTLALKTRNHRLKFKINKERDSWKTSRSHETKNKTVDSHPDLKSRKSQYAISR